MRKAILQPQFHFGCGCCESYLLSSTIQKSASLGKTPFYFTFRKGKGEKKKEGKVKENFSIFFYSVLTKAFSSSVLNKIQGVMQC